MTKFLHLPFLVGITFDEGLLFRYVDKMDRIWYLLGQNQKANALFAMFLVNCNSLLALVDEVEQMTNSVWCEVPGTANSRRFDEPGTISMPEKLYNIYKLLSSV